MEPVGGLTATCSPQSPRLNVPLVVLLIEDVNVAASGSEGCEVVIHTVTDVKGFSRLMAVPLIPIARTPSIVFAGSSTSLPAGVMISSALGSVTPEATPE
jgi:hypothetical protein